MSPHAGRKLVLLGWSGADWKLINPLLDTGQLPHLQGLIGRGVMGGLSAPEPLVAPMLWTSMATGKTADQHGILTSLEPDPFTGGVRRATSGSRQCKALWNILNQSGVGPHVVNWFATHPAEPLDGLVVSDSFPRPVAPYGRPWPVAPGSVHPSSMERMLAELRVHAGDLTGEDLAPFVPGLGAIDQKKDKRLIWLAVSLAAAITTHAAATWILEHESWRFLAVCYDAIGDLCHRFMRYHPPRMDEVTDEDFVLYQGVVSGVYRFHVMMLGRILQLAGPDATIMIVSEHGFHSDHLRPKGNVALSPDPNPELALSCRRPEGIVCAAGPGIRRDELVRGTSLLDIVPTILTLFGLPSGADMPGRPLLEAFEQSPDAERIPSWEEADGHSGEHPPDSEQEDAEETETVLRQLAALGYVDAPSEEPRKQVEAVRMERSYNLARWSLAAGRPAEAVPLLEDLARAKPDFVPFHLYLAQACFESGRSEQCRQIVERVLGDDAVKPVADLIFGKSSRDAGDPAQRLSRLFGEEGGEPRTFPIWFLIRTAYSWMKRWKDAERAFRAAIAVDSHLPEAHAGLAAALIESGERKEAAGAALEALGLRPDYPEAHYYLGIVLAESGRTLRAIQAFEDCLKLRPRTPSAHEWLADIHEQATGDLERSALHRRLARELSKISIAQESKHNWSRED